MAIKGEQKWKSGQLYMVDRLEHGSKEIAGALDIFSNTQSSSTNTRRWSRIIGWVENVLFGTGRHYLDDILTSRISVNTNTDARSVNETVRRHKIPQPTNDLLGRYIETNISILTENRPVPRVEPKSSSLEDQHQAELSELTIEYLWEELDMPEKMREVARSILYTGVGFLEVTYDPLTPRYMIVPEQRAEPTTPVAPGVEAPIERNVVSIDPKTGNIVFRDELGYGDVTSDVVSPFELTFPDDHYWNKGDLEGGWVLREKFVPVDIVKNKYLNPDIKDKITKKNGFFRENIENISESNVENYPLWWWERLSDLVEGPHTYGSLGSADRFQDYCILRVLDRKPSRDWPRGRTIITAGDQLIYDSPKSVGARAYDPRWPYRWHPYIRFRGEAQLGSIYGRSMVAKLLPFIRRINAIDATMIMWRRTVPIASWILPRGASPQEGLHSGMPGSYIVYDPNRTARVEPKPVYPPDYPSAAIEERRMCLQHIESISGTELVLKGERVPGTTSAAQLNLLRNQALASRSPTLQAWDEATQLVGSAMLMETKKHIGDDERYRQRISILARRKASQFSVKQFSGSMIADNVQVRIDTVSQALFSKEARQERAIEVIQYAPALVQLPLPLQKKLLEDLGWPDALSPKGADVSRARMLIEFAKQGRLELALPMPEDDPYTIHELLVAEIKSEAALDWDPETIQHLYQLIEYYREQIERIEMARQDMMMKMGAMQQGGQ